MMNINDVKGSDSGLF